jgi:hypothetical protein
MQRPKILAVFPDQIGASFSDTASQDRSAGSVWGNDQLYCDPLFADDWFLTENEETEARAAPNLLDISRLNEVMVIFMGFIKHVEGNFSSYLDILPMLQKSMVHLESLRANKHTKTLVQAVPERFSRTSDLTIIFACCLVTPVGQRSRGGDQQPSLFATIMEAIRKQSIGYGVFPQYSSKDESLPGQLRRSASVRRSEGLRFEPPAICFRCR